MNLRKISNFVMGAVIVGAMASCQNMERPALGNYPKDSNPPGGPLKFYTALEGTSVDSIRANFGNEKSASFVTGINGKAYKAATAESYITYAAPNDFSKVTSFTVSYWIKATNPAPGIGAQFLFAVAEPSHWSKSSLFMLMEDGGQSKGDSAAIKFMLQDNWFEFVGNNRIPKLLNDQWHHMALVYDQSTSVMKLYVDGVASTRTLTTKLGALNLTSSTKFILGGVGGQALGTGKDGWMINWLGGIDQFRMYGTALSATEVAALYNGKK